MSAHLTKSPARSIASACFCFVTASSAFAQVPEGCAIVSSFLTPESLTVVSPRTNQAPIPLTGIPDEIKLTVGVSRGANAVAINSLGTIAVGNVATQEQDAVVIYTLQLDGLNVVGSQRYEIGRSFSSNGSIPAIETLPDGRFLFSVGGIYNSPTVGTRTMGILDPVAGTIVSLPLTGVPMSPARVVANALAVSHDGSEIFIGQWTSSSAGGIYRVPISGGNASLVGSTPDGVVGIDVDNSGNVVIAMNNAAAGLAQMDVSTGSFNPIPGTPVHLAGVAVEHATGNFIYCGADGTLQNKAATLVENGALSTLGTYQFGTLSGIDINHSPRTYGSPTPGSNQYTWVTRNNPGGIPLMGNGNFSLTLDSMPSAAQLSLLVVGQDRGLTSVRGVDLLVDPATLVTLPLSSAARVTVPLPLPMDPTLQGVVLHAQSLHLESSGTVAASAGISFGPVTP